MNQFTSQRPRVLLVSIGLILASVQGISTAAQQSPHAGEGQPGHEVLPPGAVPTSLPPLPEQSGRRGAMSGVRDETMAMPATPPGAEVRVRAEPLAVPATPAPSDGERRAPWTLADFEQMALEHNPSLPQAVAMTNVSRARAWQAGQWPNPTIGYVGEVVGPAGAPLGEFQGFRVRQEVPMANKQRISRRKYEWEAQTARHHAEAQVLRVVNGVRIRYYEVLAQQWILDLQRLLLRINDAGLRTTEQLVNDGQANAPDLLAAQIQLRQARLDVIKAENDYRRSWVSLVTVVGATELGPPARLEGTLEGVEGPVLDFDEELERLLRESPHLHAAQAEVRRDEVTVLRERVEPIPNLILQVDNGYSFTEQGYATNYFIGGVVPLWNRNKGTILQAQSDMAQSRANVQRIALDLQRRLADVFAPYETAAATAREYRDEILPRARQATQLLEQGYRERRVAWPQVLVAQRNWTQLSVDYVHALFELRRREIEIQGLLMVDGLSVPEGPNELGHLNATPQPR